MTAGGTIIKMPAAVIHKATAGYTRTPIHPDPYPANVLDRHPSIRYNARSRLIFSY